MSAAPSTRRLAAFPGRRVFAVAAVGAMAAVGLHAFGASPPVLRAGFAACGLVRARAAAVAVACGALLKSRSAQSISGTAGAHARPFSLSRACLGMCCLTDGRARPRSARLTDSKGRPGLC